MASEKEADNSIAAAQVISPKVDMPHISIKNGDLQRQAFSGKRFESLRIRDQPFREAKTYLRAQWASCQAELMPTSGITQSHLPVQ